MPRRHGQRPPQSSSTHGGVDGAGNEAAHLNVAHAVVDADQRLVPQQRQRARNDSHDHERRRHARPLGEADAVNVVAADLGHVQCAAEDGKDLRAVVARRLARLEALARRRDVRLALGGQHLDRVGWGGVGVRTSRRRVAAKGDEERKVKGKRPYEGAERARRSGCGEERERERERAEREREEEKCSRENNAQADDAWEAKRKKHMHSASRVLAPKTKQ